MSQITISKRFFEVELKNYSDWKRAFWRELFQNSVDAGSTEIHVNITQGPKGDVVSFQDNGPGMTRETLENVYFQLGETTKISTDTVGGFGKARILTCFAHEGYEILTQTSHVVGSGSEYSLTEIPLIPGCLVTIETAHSMMYSLKDFLSLCSIKCAVYINGEKFSNWYRTYKVSAQNELGSIYVNKKGSSDLMVVRVNGVWMFSRWVTSTVPVILELDLVRSREVLLSNRDGMSYQYSRMLDKMVSDLQANQSAVLKETPKTLKVYGDLKTRRSQKKAEKDENVSHTSKGASEEKTQDRESASEPIEDIYVKTHTLPPSYKDAPKYEKKEYVPSDVLDVRLDGYVVVNEATNSTTRNRARWFDPINWVNGHGGKRQRVWQIWTKAVEAVLDIAMPLYSIERIAYATGFVLSDNVAAKNMYVDGGFYLLVNPLNSSNTLNFGVNDKTSYMEYLSLAVHEVAHCIHGDHDETYAGVVTTIMGKIFMNLDGIYKAMGEC